jgi:hypothetical protein
MKFIRKIKISGQVKKLATLLSLTLLLTGCPYGYKYNQGWLPTTPVNMQEFNTEWDDYNMDAPIFENTIPILFSSNRKSQGENFDIIYEIFQIQFDRDDGTISAGKRDYRYDLTRELQILQMVPPTINTSYNEMGPYLIDYYTLYSSYDYSKYGNKYLVLYANDSTGNLDIMYTTNFHQGFDTVVTFMDPQPVTCLNTVYNEAYPSVDPKLNRIYYCSDQNGDFDIFMCQISTDDYIPDVLQDTLLNPEITRSDILSSDEDDKCPYVMANIMVFTSNRTGGYGGFDLWYAKKDTTGWSAPINFGNKVNTEYNEYRPIIVPMYRFRNDLLMFSSDRPGGKGGYDLYWVGVESLIEEMY